RISARSSPAGPAPITATCVFIGSILLPGAARARRWRGMRRRTNEKTASAPLKEKLFFAINRADRRKEKLFLAPLITFEALTGWDEARRPAAAGQPLAHTNRRETYAHQLHAPWPARSRSCGSHHALGARAGGRTEHVGARERRQRSEAHDRSVEWRAQRQD